MPKIPAWAWIIAALVVWGWWGHHEARLAREQIAVMKAAAVEAVAKAKAEERRVQDDQREVIATTEKQLAQSHSTLAAADAAIGRLRLKLAGISTPADSATAATGPSAADLAGALSACITEYRSVGEAAVAAAAAGERCSGLYDALRH